MTKASYQQTGRKVPKLRLPEFSGEWEDMLLRDIVSFKNGKAHENDISDNGRYTVINSKFISSDGNVRKTCR